MNRETQWIRYWNSSTGHEKLMWHNMRLFIRESHPLVDYRDDDIVLDIGCGPGHFADLMHGKVEEIHSADTSEFYIGQCAQRFHNGNLFFYKMDKHGQNRFSFLHNKKISLFVAVSVIQYFDSLDDVKSMIQEAQTIAAPGARLLIADIPVADRKLLEGIGLVTRAVKEGCAMEAVKTLAKSLLSSYSSIRNDVGLMIPSEEELNDFVAGLRVDAQVLSQPLTLHGRNRRHVLVHF